MPTLGADVYTLADWAVFHTAEGSSIRPVIEYMAKTNEILDDVLWKEGNLATGDMSLVRTQLPTVQLRSFNQYVPATKGGMSATFNACAKIEAWSKADKALVDLGDPAADRALMDLGHIQAMANAFADMIFYGNQVANTKEFTGLAPRVSAVANSQFISGGSNDTDNTSVYLIVWSPMTAYGIFPKGSQAGLQVEDKGEQIDRITVGDAVQQMVVYETQFIWDCGISIVDPRFLVRIGNIEVSDLTANAATGAVLIDLMIDAIEKIPSMNALTTYGTLEAAREVPQRAAFYCNRTIRAVLRKQAKNSTNVYLSLDEVAGKRALTFDGVPIRICDSITNVEPLVT